MYRELLVNPDRFFDRRVADPRFLPPLVIVVGAGLAAMSSTLLVLPVLAETLSGTSRTVAQVATVLGALSGGIGIVALWFIYAGSFHTISLLFGGTGRFRTTFLVTGWGFLPLLVGGLLGGIALFVTVQGVEPPRDPAGLEAFVRDLPGRPVMRAAAFVKVALLCWQAHLWVFAMKHARGLSLRESALTVALPVGITLAWNALEFF